VPGRHHGRVTLQQVGAELGVSAKTVSNAYGRPDQLSAGLRDRILATAERMGYAGPDPVAAGLRRGRVGAFGVAYANPLSYAFEDPVSVALLAGITSVAERAGTGLLLASGSGEAEPTAGTVRTALIDGLVVASLSDDDPVLQVALARHVPLVVLDQPDPALLAHDGVHPPWIGIDDHAAAADAAQHVLDLGHRRLGVVSFSLGRPPVQALVDERAQAATTYAVTRRRLAGYRAAAVSAGVEWAGVPVATAGAGDHVAEGAAAARALLGRSPRPTALLCLSDRLAEGALRAAADLGLRVPADLSIVGFDDAEPAARLGLTTIRQPTRRKGELAATALLDLLAGREPQRVQLLPTELVVRTSTGRAPD
jgi:DNA-binding LacI/PurR family transcriptional regulator